MRAIYGKKKMMTRIFDEKGHQTPVTIVEVMENVVSQVKTLKKDGYQALQVGAGSSKKTGIKHQVLYEIKAAKELKVGDKISLDEFKEKEKVNITAISKGKGFAGTVKRHHFHTGPRTHGSNNYRQPGSIGSAFPQRVIKGRRMAGHLGAKRTTVKNLEIFKIEIDNGRIYLKGAVPGGIKAGVLIWSES